MKITITAIALLLVAMLAWWFWPVRCANDGVINEYLSLIEQANKEYEKALRVPTRMMVESSCIAYVPDDVPTKAFVWLQLPSGHHLGYIVPNMGYAIADYDFDGIADQRPVIKVLKNIRNEALQRHLGKYLPGYSLQSAGSAAR